MCCAIAALLKFVITTINVILGIAFLVVALLGLLLKTSAGFVKSLLKTCLSFGGDVPDDQAMFLTEFVLEHATSLSIVLIVVGLILAALCFVGAFAACCICGLLLKIYAIILGVLLVAQIIAVAVLFSNPTKLSQSCNEVLTQMLVYFGQDTDMGKVSTMIWNFTMTVRIAPKNTTVVAVKLNDQL
ncbi:unnamed protein product [Dibothriocephalus latus]|uniref:Tetraspanin n=1 Tax=Dibothriocephalus latus TaxID=60516 RepID=A0A3P6UAB9_DIBLA|nr:unnamed protein product [Dibothriocephalus latus]